jgi:hypothetical protein
VAYNEDVYGAHGWDWPNFCGGCDCPPHQGAASRGLAKDAAGTWTRPKAHKSARSWVEDHLAAQLPGGGKIWPAVDGMLREVGCRVGKLPYHEESTVEIVSAVADAADAAERLQRAKSVFDLYEQESQRTLFLRIHCIHYMANQLSFSSLHVHPARALRDARPREDDHVRMAARPTRLHRAHRRLRLPDRAARREPGLLRVVRHGRAPGRRRLRHAPPHARQRRRQARAGDLRRVRARGGCPRRGRGRVLSAARFRKRVCPALPGHRTRRTRKVISHGAATARPAF